MLLRTLVGGVIRDAARQSLEEAVTKANEELPRGDIPCDCLVIFALGVESGGLVDMLEEYTTTKGPSFTEHAGVLEGHRIVIVNSGVGREAAAAASLDCIRVHRPKWVISAGFAGGLAENLRKGHFVLPAEVIDPDGNSIEVLQFTEQEAIDADPRLHGGRLATVDQIMATTEEKKTLAKQRLAIACDMETSAVARVCRDENISLMSVRIISDAVDDKIPPEVATLLAQKSLASKLGAAAGAIFKRPSSALDMWQLKEDALKATDRLAKFLRGMIAQLPNSDPSPADE